ncbi:MAG: GTPase Era [Clostridia bacterium]|nr:GTPase Era [Clostridia bacterium]
MAVLFRSGFVAVVGRPNVGKSSLVNTFVGGKVAIVSDKPQTTRNRIMGVVNGEGYQLVLVDTPGMQSPRNRLGAFMESAVSHAMTDVDAILCVVDGHSGLGERDEAAIERAVSSRKRVILAVNKTDKAQPEEIAALCETLRQRPSIHAVYPVSALTGDGLAPLLTVLIEMLPEGPAYFPEDMISDKTEDFLCAEAIREKALLLLREEVPHGLGVELEKFMERPDGLVEVHAVIYCERESHKRIIIGKGGRMLKRIGSMAREDMEHFFDTKVFLSLYVKVREEWRNSPRALRDLGYD